MKQIISKKCFDAGSLLSQSYSQFLLSKFPVQEIGLLHTAFEASVLKHGTDQATPIHNLIYAEFDRGEASELVKIYRTLQREWLVDLQDDFHIPRWALQRYPSLRVHLPTNVSVFEFHRDSDYMHPLGEINHFLSLNHSVSSASLHIEEDLGWENYVPLELSSGQSAIINTSIFKHGDFSNSEGYTRVSIDFRAIPFSVLENSGPKSSITKGKRFDCTDYFIDSVELLK